MTEYTVTFARSARKELEGLAAVLVGRLMRAIESLASNPFPRGCRKLQKGEGLWRIRVGAYRVVYAVDTQARVVDIVAVRHRRDAYR